ncbi:MAG: hypothetical protein WBW06_21705 [Xanthobacteraceae bacterium]
MRRRDGWLAAEIFCLVGFGKIIVLVRRSSLNRRTATQFGIRIRYSDIEECDPMKKLAVLTALMLGAVALTLPVVAIPRDAAACSQTCMNCCN